MLCTREIVVNKDGSSQFKSSSPGTFFWRVVGPFVLCCEPPTFNPCFCLLRADTSCLHHMGPSLSNFVLKHIYLPSPPIMSLFRLEVSQGNRNYFGYFKQEGIYFREIVFFSQTVGRAGGLKLRVSRPLFSGLLQEARRRGELLGDYCKTSCLPAAGQETIIYSFHFSFAFQISSEWLSLAGSNLNSTGEFQQTVRHSHSSKEEPNHFLLRNCLLITVYLFFEGSGDLTGAGS